MPKRYKVLWGPGTSTGTSTANFEKAVDDPNDSCPNEPKAEEVPNERKDTLEKDRKKHKEKPETWTCGEIRHLLGVTLAPKSHT